MNPSPPSFAWPDGQRAAVSLSWDDARVSQVDNGIPILDEYDVRGTFYVIPHRVEERLDQWKAAVARGHEIGNHTVNHPSGGNFTWQRPEYRLEGYTLEQIQREIDEADRRIQDLLAMRPTTFAYCAGQTFVGRGLGVKSYVPLIARRFLIGRTYFLPTYNLPDCCDRAQINGIGIDNLSFEQVRSLIETAVNGEGWIVLVGHDIGNPQDRLNTSADVLKRICDYLKGRPEIWLDTVAAVGGHLNRHLGEDQKWPPSNRLGGSHRDE
ncbi:MAG: polysaccharide deacetylase family protein [Opitutaceae bacterium]|nr:polysaccharide deacetylase family protein [Opitutaceae bacterium]